MKQSLIKLLTLTLALLAGGSAWAEPLRVGMFIDATSVDGIASPQEKAAAQWFQSAFVDQGIGAFITNDAAPVLYQPGGTPKYDVIWINVDRVDDANLPSYLTNETNSNAFKKYYNEGHNFYLTKVATKYAVSLGRMTMDVNMCNVAAGFPGYDDWLIRLFTENASAKYMSNGLTYTQFGDKDYPSYYIHGTGDGNTSLYRENHNVGWDNGKADGAKAKFESEYKCKVLGTWDHDNGNVALIVEFPATDGVSGTIITNGVAAYQWQSADTNNKYISNVERLTSNTLNYLAGFTGLVMHFPMELHNSEYVYDLVTGTKFHVEGQFPRENLPGAAGQALRFDGYTTQINGTIANTLPEGSRQMTVSLWTAIESYPIVQVDVRSSDKVNIFSCLDDANKSGFAFGISFEGKWSFKTYVGDNLVEIAVDTPMPTYQWNNLVAVLDCDAASKITLYLNGKEVGSANANGVIKLGPGQLIVGHNAIDNYASGDRFCITAFNGLLDDVKVWNEVIPLSTIQAWEPENEADLTIPESRYANDKWRPRFHGMPGAGWSNECHGMVYSNGRYHLFFQKNANCPEMIRLHWGHISSENLYDWREEPIAIMPGDAYDIKGCWSGAVFTDPVIGAGNPYIIYTGVDYGHASIVGASPQDADLVKWTKLGELIPGRPGGLDEDFRDPYFFRNGDNAYIIVGGRKGGLGVCTLHRYNAADGSWSNNEGDIFFQSTNAAEDGTFWEMSNVTKMPTGKWLFTTTPLGCAGDLGKGVRTLYWTGSINAEGKFVADFTNGKNLELCAGNGFGLLSPTIYQHNGKTLCLGIVPDILSQDMRKVHGFSAHCYSLPRELSLEGETLIQKPYSGLTGLRTATSYTKSNFNINGEEELGAVNGRSVEICGVFTIGDAPFGFKFFKTGDNEASISYDPATNTVTLNCQTLAREVNDGGHWRGLYTMPIPESLAEGSELKLDVFIDHSIVDVFVNDRWASSIRVYPLNPDADGLRVYSTGNVTVKSLNAWVLDPKASSESGSGSGSGSSEPALEPLKVAMFIDAPSVGEIASPQEKAAAQWFKSTYVEQGTGAFITNASAPELYWSDGSAKYDVVWINVDRVGSSALPAYLIENFADFKKYYNEGHNFYLTKAASQYAVNLDRLSANVDLATNAAGDVSSGDWWIRLFTDGNASAQFLANGLYSQTLSKNTYLSYGMHGNGSETLYREDHNTGWNTSSLAGTGAKVLGTWDHNTGDVALIVEFPATGTSGTIITNGVGAYQWQTNDANNLYIDNVERLTANAINFLAGDTNPESKVAMYIDSDRVKTIASQQERSAAEWFKRAWVYQGTGEFITNTTAASTITTDNYACVWVNLDRDGYSKDALTDYLNNNWAAFQSYCDAGGALYLSKMATDMLYKLGRITEDLKPTSVLKYNTETISDPNDWWGINPYINYNGIAAHGWYRDNTSHPVFAGLQMGTLQSAPYQTYPLIGCNTGETIKRIDQNWSWDLATEGLGLKGDGVNKVVKFEETCVAKVLGTWTHVKDDASAIMVEFYPINGKGRIIANGASAYQWNDANAYTANMERLSDNCLRYLVDNNRQKIYLGMWIDAADVAEIGSTQEKNAAEWFMETVVSTGHGEFITTNTPGSVINTTNYKTIWVNISRLEYDSTSALPASLSDKQDAFNTYYEAKGNFLLTNYGNVFAKSLGRVSVLPDVWDTNLKGTENADVWGIRCDFEGSEAFDGGTRHPIYNNLTTMSGSVSFPMIGGGIANSTNYNCFWANSTLTDDKKGKEDPTRYRVLGTWQQNTNADSPTVVQFDPKVGYESVQGCILACGASAYQWTDGNVEEYQTNVEIFTLNSLNYLAGYYWDPVSGGVSGAEDVEVAPAEEGPARFFNLQGIEVDGSNLTPGIYIRIQGNKTTKFLVK